MSRIIARTPLDAYERLYQAAEPTLQLDVSLKRDQTDATFFRIHHRIVLDRFIGLVKIAGAVAAEMMRERTFEHTGPFGTGMTVTRQSCSWYGLEHEDPDPVV